MQKFNKGDFVYINLKGDHMYARLTEEPEYNDEKGIVALYFDKLYGLTMVPKIGLDGTASKLDKVIISLSNNTGTGEGCMMIPYSQTPVVLSHLDTASELYTSLAAEATKSSLK